MYHLFYRNLNKPRAPFITLLHTFFSSSILSPHSATPSNKHIFQSKVATNIRQVQLHARFINLLDRNTGDWVPFEINKLTPWRRTGAISIKTPSRQGKPTTKKPNTNTVTPFRSLKVKKNCRAEDGAVLTLVKCSKEWLGKNVDRSRGILLWTKANSTVWCRFSVGRIVVGGGELKEGWKITQLVHYNVD